MSVFVFAVVSAGILLLVSGIYVFIVACVRAKEVPWLVKEEVDKTAYAKYHPLIISSDKWLKEHDAEDVFITSYDGLKLHGLWIPACDAKGTVIFAHGYRSTFLVDFSMAFDYYHKLGLNILVPDQRSHGKSEGKFITFGVKESRDIQQWVTFHNNSFGALPIILSGLSMGASTVLFLADKDLPVNVKGVIADCGFTSPKEIIASVFQRVIHLPAAPTIWITEFLARSFAGFSLYTHDTRKALANSKVPVLLIHGTEDHFVPPEMSQQGYDACTSDKTLLLVEGAEHGLSFLADRNGYCSAISAFIHVYINLD